MREFIVFIIFLAIILSPMVIANRIARNIHDEGRY